MYIYIYLQLMKNRSQVVRKERSQTGQPKEKKPIMARQMEEFRQPALHLQVRISDHSSSGTYQAQDVKLVQAPPSYIKGSTRAQHTQASAAMRRICTIINYATSPRVKSAPRPTTHPLSLTFCVSVCSTVSCTSCFISMFINFSFSLI